MHETHESLYTANGLRVRELCGLRANKPFAQPAIKPRFRPNDGAFSGLFNAGEPDMSALLEQPATAMAADAQRPAELAFRQLSVGDPFPWLIQACGEKEKFGFDTFAGRYQLFCFFLEASTSGEALSAVTQRRDLFNDQHCSFFGVSVTPSDRDVLRLCNLEPGIRFAWDFDGSMSQACGALPIAFMQGSATSARRCWIVVDPSLHVLKVFSFAANSSDVIAYIEELPPPDRFGGISRPAPILILPNVFELELCRALIEEYDRQGGAESGVHREGRGVIDPGFKRRKDVQLENGGLLYQATSQRIGRRVVPEIERLFFMKAYFIERHIVGCYAAADGGHFGPHRDNRQGATHHRRFAVSINLNDDFEGGEVSFPEYGSSGYKAPAGWCVVFPCAALHAVSRVTKGARYAFLPFVYDEGGRAIRERTKI